MSEGEKVPRESVRDWPRRIVSEFAVIVVGVLVALLAQSAWESRGDARQEHEALLRIREELRADSIDLLNDELNHELIFPAMEQARSVLQGTDTLSDGAALAVLYGAALVNTPSAERGTWFDLTSSGRSFLISSPELRQRLISYYSQRDLRDRARDAMPAEYRARVVSVVPLDMMTAVLQRCVRREEGMSLTQGARSGGLENLVGCGAISDVEAAPYLARLRSLPDLDLALGERRYEEFVFSEGSMALTRQTFDSLVVALDRELAERR